MSITQAMTAHTMTIGEASSASGVSAKMIRYYETIGLIRPATRGESGYRHYADTDIHTLRFVRRARDLGFSVADIAHLLALWRDRDRSSAEVKQVAQHHIATLRRKLAELQQMVGTLEHLADCCHGDARPDCPIIDELAGEAAERRPMP